MSNLSDIIREGQTKTLEVMELMKKQMAGTITSPEEVRLAMLNGNLLALAMQAQGMGYGLAVAPERVEVEGNDEYDSENEDCWGGLDGDEEEARFWNLG